MNYRSDLYPTGRKHCSHCRRWRLVIDFGSETRRGAFYLKSFCHTCERIRGRIRNAKARGRAEPYQAQVRATHCHQGHPLSGSNVYVSYSAGYACRNCLACQHERYRQPEYREWSRIYQEVKRRERGIEARPVPGHAPQGPGERLRIPVRPFAEWLKRNAPTRDRGAWAIAHEIDDSAISKILSGKYETVHIDTVDRCLRYEEESLIDLYPELYEFDDDLVVAA